MLLWLFAACSGTHTAPAAISAPRIAPTATVERACPPPDAAERTHCVLLRPSPRPGAVALQEQLSAEGYIAWLEGIDVAVELDPAGATALLGQGFRWEQDGPHCLAHLTGAEPAGRLAGVAVHAAVGHRACE